MQLSREYLERYVRTLRQVPPSQIAARLRLRGLRLIERRFPTLGLARGRALGAIPRWPESFVALGSVVPQGDAEDIVSGYLTLLGERRSIADVSKWNEPSVPRLWNFTLEYFEWAWALAAHPDRDRMANAFEDIWTSWDRETRFPLGDAWAPYPVSLRLWVMCSINATLVAGRDYDEAFRTSIDLHARYLRRHLELDIGGNHLIKNLKALIGAGVFLGDAEMTLRASERLAHQLRVQILADGGHYERSPAYHCQVLGDLIDVDHLLAAAGHRAVDGLGSAIAAMRRWLGSMLAPGAQLPLFNDGAALSPEEVLALEPIVDSVMLRVLRDSGFIVVAVDDRSFCVIDAGDPCPRELPGHAHADCLSFELWIDGQRWICDTGTSTYEAGERRDYERSTAAHNTVMIDGIDQTEVWGAFRAGRRAHGRILCAAATDGSIHIAATHDGYEHLSGSPTHTRHFTFSAGMLVIVDEITGVGSHDLASALLADPRVSGVTIGAHDHVVDTVEERATDFGERIAVLRYGVERRGVELPASLTWTLQWS